MDTIFGGMRNLIRLIIDWLNAVFGSWNDSLEYPVYIFVIIILIAWFFSGMAAAQIAEKRGHKTIVHFLFGLLIPVIYPLIIKKSLPDEIAVAEAAAKEKAETAAAEAPKYTAKKDGIQFKTDEDLAREAVEAAERAKQFAEAAALAAEKGIKSKYVSAADAEDIAENRVAEDTPPELDPEAEITMEYLTKIALNANGTAAGPYCFVLKDGSEFVVKRILNPLDGVVVLELPPEKEGASCKNVRIPYARIQTVKAMNK